MDELIPPAPSAPPVPPAKPTPWFKISLIIFGVLVIIGLFGNLYLLAKNQKPAAQVTPTPTQTAITSTPDETASWKTHATTKFSFKYPNTWFVGTSADGTILLDSKSIEAGKVVEPNQVAITIETVTDQNLINSYLANPPGDSEKRIINSVSFDYISVNYQGGQPPKQIIFAQAKIGNSLYRLGLANISVKDTFDQILSTFKFLDQNQADATANWKTYQNKNGYSIKYPPALTVVPDTGWKDPEDIAEATGISIRDQSLVDPLKSPQFNLYVFSPENTIYKGLNTLKEIADANFKENDHPETHIRTIEEVHETQFKGELAYEYTIESKGFFAGWSGFLGDQGVIKIITFKHSGKYFQIGLYDTPVFDQILSTFKFLP